MSRWKREFDAPYGGYRFVTRDNRVFNVAKDFRNYDLEGQPFPWAVRELVNGKWIIRDRFAQRETARGVVETLM